MAGKTRGQKRVDNQDRGQKGGCILLYMEGRQISTPPSSGLVPGVGNVAEDYPSVTEASLPFGSRDS